MEPRRPRINVLLTQAEDRWLSWWAEQTGRPRAEAASRLLSAAIEAERAKPALERAFQDDQRAGPIEREILADVGRAFNTPGVVHALQNPAAEHTETAAQAARYLQDISHWIADPRLPIEKGVPPQLDQSPPVVLLTRDVEHPMQMVGKVQVGFARTHGPRMALEGSDKRQLSDLGAQAWLMRYAGRSADEG